MVSVTSYTVKIFYLEDGRMITMRTWATQALIKLNTWIGVPSTCPLGELMSSFLLIGNFQSGGHSKKGRMFLVEEGNDERIGIGEKYWQMGNDGGERLSLQLVPGHNLYFLCWNSWFLKSWIEIYEWSKNGNVYLWFTSNSP